MRPGWHPDEETQKPTSDGKVFERAALSFGIGFLVFAIALAVYLFGCTANGQEAPVMLMPEIVYDETTPQALHRSAMKQRAIPALPSLPQPIVSRVVTTNENRSRRITIIEQDIQPPALVQDKPRTNAFWVACPHCSVRAIRAPVRMETNGVVTVPDGDTIERTIYFRCCKTEFRARNFKFVETPIAEEVTLKEPIRNTQ